MNMPLTLHLYSDIHNNLAACEKIAARASEADVIVIAGDLCVMRRGLDKTIAALRKIRTPAVLVPGNGESFEELQEACRMWESATVLHGSGAMVAGIPFFGIGGGIPRTPFGDWSWDFGEMEARTLLAACPAGAILVSHSPPNGAADRASGGQHVGSTAVRECVLEKEPALVVCGHIHDSWGQQVRLGKSMVVNAGPAGTDWTLSGNG